MTDTPAPPIPPRNAVFDPVTIDVSITISGLRINIIRVLDGTYREDGLALADVAKAVTDAADRARHALVRHNVSDE